ncbi:LamB/YcsF family protein [Pseudoluteimonas lycopersici]|uniref:LamB/YcsF family protein n=1 Tax=Pseudoluteimonas lycopersici TaxID=1324796 RepID=A0A516V2F0_9GAMM|nr:5-oxoprolinase subunit PxpA [Lysobacter lycopersici]QDQ72700.1 LamB/YcsF family protein [Lysobacter lycopersici]
MPSLDFNCDLGEGCGQDAAIVSHISSASIACGAHAGDAATMRELVALCLAHGVAIGAHPSFEDREHFGRRELALAPAEIHALVARQITLMANACVEAGARLHHVKPHGALYNLAARDRDVAAAIAEAVRESDPALVLYGLANSELTTAGEAAGLRVAHEAFAERAYDADGRLAPRGTPGAVIESFDNALAQVRGFVRDGVVVARDGTRVPIRADTLCLHGDRSDAAEFARGLRAALEAESVSIRAPGRDA